MGAKTVKELVLEKAQLLYGESVYYGDESDDIVINPNHNYNKLPWRYSYNLGTERERIEEQERMDDFYFDLFQTVMNQYFDGEKCRPFEKIYIATNNICNGKCNFCSLGNDKSVPMQIIEDDVIDKIIAELKAIGFKGKISLHGINEPLLDLRIVDICKKFKKSLPECKLQILTNGTRLSIDLVSELVSTVDRIDVHCYADKLEVPERLLPVVKYCRENVDPQKIKFYLRLQNEILSQKGYGPCGRTKFANIKSGCIMPFTTLSIIPPGIVSYCDSDYKGIGSMGDIKHESIMEIWNSQKFNDYRRQMIQGRAFTEFCNRCDFF